MKYDYHQNQLTKIKRGVKASFISFVQRGKENFLRVRKDGVETDFEFNGTFDQLTPQAYAELENNLQQYYYGE